MFEWDDILSVGIEVVDDQHQELFRIGRELVYVLENTSAGLDQYDDIIKLLKELHTYANYHFSEEEKLMEAVPEPAPSNWTAVAVPLNAPSNERNDSITSC